MCETQPELLFRCNIQCQNGLYVDLNGGGGRNPEVAGVRSGDHKINVNQIWNIYFLPSEGFNDPDRVVIQNLGNDKSLCASGHEHPLLCSDLPWESEEAQWVLEGIDVRTISNGSVVRFRNVMFEKCFMDIFANHTENLTPIQAYEENGGPAQNFIIWKR